MCIYVINHINSFNDIYNEDDGFIRLWDPTTGAYTHTNVIYYLSLGIISYSL